MRFREKYDEQYKKQARIVMAAPRSLPRFIYILCLGIFALGVLLPFASADATTISLSVTSPVVGVNTGDAIDLDIFGVNNGSTSPLGAFDLTLSFNPALLSFQSANFSDELGPIFGPGDIQSVTPGTGSVEVSETSLESPAELSAQASDSQLVVFSFYSLASGTSPLTVTLNSLLDANGNPIAATVNSSSVTIQASPVPLPAPGFLLIAGLAGLWAAARRDRKSLTPTAN